MTFRPTNDAVREGRGDLVGSDRPQPVTLARSGGSQSCVIVANPAGSGAACFTADPFTVADRSTGASLSAWYALGLRPDLRDIVSGAPSTWLTRVPGRDREGSLPVVGAIAVNPAANDGAGQVAFVAGVSDDGTRVLLDEAGLHGAPGVFLNVTAPARSFSGYLYGGPAVAPQVAEPRRPAAPSANRTETAGEVVGTWTGLASGRGKEGPLVPVFGSAVVSCRERGQAMADGNTWWYKIASAPWSGRYFASADAFYNNGAGAGSLRNTPFYDAAVPTCGSKPRAGSPSSLPLRAETTDQ